MVIARRNALLLLLAAALSGCKIVDNKDLMTARAKSDSEFDAAAYVDKIWDSKALPEFKSKAVDLDTVLQAVAQDPDKAGKTYGQRAGEGNPWTYEIKGQGKIVAVDTASRHGIVTVETETKNGPRKVDLQIGPVVFGTAVRDALPFIHFGDFVNQIQYAQVSRVLNDRAVKNVRESFDPKDALGKTVVFYAAAVLSGGDTITATPVLIETAKGEKT
jgi:predicted lipoprotein